MLLALARFSTSDVSFSESFSDTATMLDPRRLAVLREFAAQGTIARAAEALSFTPSAVSQQLSQLQRESGVALFRRAGRRLELTDAGRMLAARAGELLARLEEVEAELAQAAGDVRGTVRVAAFQTAVARARAAGDRPARRDASEPADGARGARGGGVAAARSPAAGSSWRSPRSTSTRRARTCAGLERAYLDPDEMVLALPAAHAAAAGDPVPLAAVRDLAWATGHAGTAYSDMVTRVCRAVGGFEPDVRHRVSDMDLLLGLVAGGRAAAVVPTLGRPEREPGVAVRRIAERRLPAGAVRRHARERPRPPRDRRRARGDRKGRAAHSTARRTPRPPDPPRARAPTRGAAFRPGATGNHPRHLPRSGGCRALPRASSLYRPVRRVPDRLRPVWALQPGRLPSWAPARSCD